MSLTSLPQTPEEFVAALRIPAMVLAARTGIPAPVIIAQACLETGFGKAIPTDVATGRYSYNLFGIKWTGQGDYVTAWTTEFSNGKWVRAVARFRAYPDFQASLEDYAALLLLGPRYRGCLQTAADPEAYVRCVAAAGFATDPHYADKVIAVMRKWNLLRLKPGPFPDVSADDPAAEAIAFCKGAGLMVGRADGLFHPDEPVTRREMAIILQRLHGRGGSDQKT